MKGLFIRGLFVTMKNLKIKNLDGNETSGFENFENKNRNSY